MTAPSQIPVRAYVLDDDPGMLKLVCRALVQKGIVSQPFSDSAGLFTALAEQPCDLLVLDLALGRSDGIEVIRQLESIDYRGKVLLISGRDAATLAEASKIGGAHGLAMLEPLTKPFLIADLIARLSGDVAPLLKAVAPTMSTVSPSLDLLRAFADGWMTLWYQPKFAIATGRLSGAEALIRMNEPTLGTILPGAFLPPAGSPLHRPLSEFVLSRVIADWRTFASRGLPLKLAINMPVSMIVRPDFVANVRGQLPTEPGFPGLIVEVTEDEIVEDQALITEVATQLGLYNVRLSIDDVGTAHSGLSRFLDLPFVEAKIDRRFVSGCATDVAKRTLCSMIISLAHRFNAVACAEGVENAADLAALAELGCDTAQGFYLAKPMPVDAFIRFAGLQESQRRISAG